MENKVLNYTDLLWLCGFVSSESEDEYKHTEEERKTLKRILKQLRKLK